MMEKLMAILIGLLMLLAINNIAAAAQLIQRDPTMPIDAANIAQMGNDNFYGLKIDTIIITKTQRSAIINGQRLQIDDKINGLVVKDIEPYEVKLSSENEEITIKMPCSDIKQEVKTPKPQQ